MIRLIKGFHDILPDDAAKWDFLVTTARDTLERYGFRQIITPIMEHTELFVRGIGEVTDIVEKEMYTFEDVGGKSLTLRPEATAGILRAVAEHSLLHKEPVLKMYTIGPMFRRERPSQGRFRQFFQVNAEVLGDDSPLTDAEVIAGAHAIMRNIGAKGLMIELNSVGCAQCRAQYRILLKDFLKDYLGELCPDCQRRYDRNPLRVMDCKVERCTEIVQDAPLIVDSLDAPCRGHFQAVRDALDVLSIPYRIEPRMVRGLDYYTRTAFEIVHEELGRSKAVGGGGRYDTLLKELGGPDVGGIGFAIGLERLSMGISNDDPRFAQSVDAYVAPLGDKAEKQAFTIVNRLREAGLIAEIRFGSKSLKSHMKQADKLGARTVLMLGEDELARNEITVRDMQAGKQVSVKLENLIGFLSSALNPGKPHLSENETRKKTTVKSKAEKKLKGHRKDGRGKA